MGLKDLGMIYSSLGLSFQKGKDNQLGGTRMNIIRPSVTCADVKQYFQDLSKELSEKYKHKYDTLGWIYDISRLIFILIAGIILLQTCFQFSLLKLVIKLVIPEIIIFAIAVVIHLIYKWKLKCLFDLMEADVRKKNIPLPYIDKIFLKTLIDAPNLIQVPLDAYIRDLDYYKDLEILESLNENTEIRYNTKLGVFLYFDIYIDSHLYENFKIQIKGTEEFKKATHLDFSYIDEHFQFLNESTSDEIVEA